MILNNPTTVSGSFPFAGAPCSANSISFCMVIFGLLWWGCIQRHSMLVTIKSLHRRLKFLLFNLVWRLEATRLRGILFLLYRLQSLKDVSNPLISHFVSHSFVCISWLAFLPNIV